MSAASQSYGNELTDEALLAFMAESGGDGALQQLEVPPAAEDVLVQRIKGDNNHLLMMAYYSKENYAGQFVTIDDGGTQLVFRDDGQGDDKIAGDGFFTAKINANASEFRQLAKQMSDEIKRSGQKRIRFINRKMVVDPDAEEGFDEQSFDNSQAVSVSALSRGGGSNKLLDSIQL